MPFACGSMDSAPSVLRVCLCDPAAHKPNRTHTMKANSSIYLIDPCDMLLKSNRSFQTYLMTHISFWWIALTRIPLDLADDKSILVHVIAWCCQATNHFLEPMLTKLHDTIWHHQGLYSLRRRRLISLGIPIINLRRSSDRLRFIMGPYTRKTAS